VTQRHSHASVVVLLADGVRPDTLQQAIDGGSLPSLAAMRAAGGLHTVTSCFPSVTGPAYAPFLMGRFPGPIGLPGLRWFDRARTVCTFPDYTRSYVGYEMGRVDRDIAADAPTIFELVPDSIAALNVIGRGLPIARREGRITARSALRAARTHFSGNVAGWLNIDREISGTMVRRIRDEHPDFVFAAFTGVDKTSHAQGHGAPIVHEALRIIDETVAQIRADAEAAGRWDAMQLWITSDHGHSPVHHHEDLAGVVASVGHRVIAHPWVYAIAPDVAVMVSGNAMAHVYVDVTDRRRPLWPTLAAQWHELADFLIDRPAVDLMLLPTDDGAIVRGRGRGEARIRRRAGRFTYTRGTGDPLGIGSDVRDRDAEACFVATVETDYPDSIVQIAEIAAAPRSGEIILSAAREWDFRSKYEPIPHVSSHGALHRDHMLVPLLTNQPVDRAPLRTVDLFPSALAALGVAPPAQLDGRSFL
jgi:hypothetical protein